MIASQSWRIPLRTAAVFFLADPLLKVFCLRQLAPGDQIQFLGQSYFAVSHVVLDPAGDLSNSVIQWGLWVLLALITALRMSESSQLEKTASLVVLAAGLSNALTRILLGQGLNVFVFQSGVNNPLVSFNLAHMAIFAGSTLLLVSWVKALWPETLTEGGARTT